MDHLEIFFTDDGSFSLRDTSRNETYHSKHGALQESMHVYIQSGLNHQLQNRNDLHILEVGFGTGLNAYLTCLTTSDNNQNIHYTALEIVPLSEALWQQLKLSATIKDQELFAEMHRAEWNKYASIRPHFELEKLNISVEEFKSTRAFDLVFFDAFGPEKQPEIWDIEILKKMFDLLQKDGVLITYCAKGQVRRDLVACGFKVERLEGPPGKREMLRATK